MSDSLVGRTLPALRFTVEPGKIGEFARATKNDDPAYVGWSEGMPAPLTFSVVSRLYSAAGDALQTVRDLGLDVARVVHGSQEWIYHGSLTSGVTLEGVPTVTEHYRKAARDGGTMTFVMVETVFRDVADGAPVVTERMLSIELPQKEETS